MVTLVLPAAQESARDGRPRSSVGSQHRPIQTSERTMIRPEGADPRRPDELTQLLVRTGRGDADAFAALYEQIAGWVYGLVLRIVRNPTLTEEVAQEVLVEVWRQAARFDPDRGSVRAWVLTIAHRRAVDRVRAEQSSAERDARVAARSYAPAHDEVAEQVELSLAGQRLRHLVAQLSEVQREAIELAYFDGYSQREIAALLDVPLGTVKTRMRDGLIRLRDAMGGSA